MTPDQGRVDRILAAYNDPDAERAIARGTSLEEVEAALSFAALDLQLERSTRRPRFADVVADFLRDLVGDDG